MDRATHRWLRQVLGSFALALWLLMLGMVLWSCAHAQQTKANLNTEINSNFPDNTTGLITPLITRTTTKDMVASWQQAIAVRLVNSGTTDTLDLPDFGQLVLYNDASNVATSIAQATGSFANYNVFVRNSGTGTVTITPTTSQINGAANLVLRPGQDAWIISDGTNYQLGPGAVLLSNMQSAWTSFTPSATCGTATFSVQTARFKQLGRTVFIELEVTITAIGTCTNVFTFTLPAVPGSNGYLGGVNEANNETMLCTPTSSVATAACAKRLAVALNNGDHFMIAGVYESQ